MSKTRLLRSESDRIIAGVCGGIADYLGVEALWVRLAFLLLVPASGMGIVAYGLLMIIMPNESSMDKPTGEVISENLDQFGESLSSGARRLPQDPQGRILLAIFLILLGLYFLFSNLGWLSGVISVIFWPAVLIGLGVYLMRRRR